MEDRTARLEAAVEELRQAIVFIQGRLDALESRAASPAAEAPDVGAAEPEEAQPGASETVSPVRSLRDPIFVLSLIGRLFLVLAGGFFLRALTDTGTLAPPIGLTLGFLYALVWLFMADRAGGRRQTPAAVFHALACVMVAFPLLVEATTRFKVLNVTASVVVVAVLTAVMLLVAWRRHLRAVSWIVVLAALPTSFALLIQTGVVLPSAVYLIALGVGTFWLGEARGWWEARWPAALAADVVVVGVALRALAPEPQDAPHVALLLQSLLLGAYAVSIAICTLRRGRNIGIFDVVQTAAVLVVGLGGAVMLTRVTGIPAAAFGIICLLGGAASYGLAVRFVDQGTEPGWNTYFYTTMAIALVLAGLILVPGGPWAGAACAVLAVLAAGSWLRFGRLFLLLHCAVYLVAAALVSGSLSYSAQVLAVAAPPAPWNPPDPVALILLVAGAASVVIVARRSEPEFDPVTSGLRLVVIVMFVLAAGGCVVGYLAPLFGARADRTVDPGVLATVRTGVLAMAALLIAWIGRSARYREWAWLVYPLLVGIGLKMVAQDFKYSRPATLFIAMGLYGVALIVAPRLRRRGATAPPKADA